MEITILPSRWASPVGLSDQELESRLRRLALGEGKFLAIVLAHLAEFDRRRLAGDFGQPSLFHYCVRVLGFSEAAAYKRIQAARAVRDFPALLEEVAQGRMSLAAVVVLSPHLSAENFHELVGAALGKAIRELEAFVASLAPRPDAPELLRALPTRAAGGARASVEVPRLPSNEGKTAPRATGFASRHPEPMSLRRYVFRFTGDLALRDKYERARALLLGRPAGAGMEALFDAALESLLERIDPERRLRRKARMRAAASRRRSRRAAQDSASGVQAAPRGRSRRVPQGVKDVVWRRDGGRCTFVGPDGQRCPESARLEYDHILPFALGGSSEEPGDIRLACREHNQLHARRRFGAAAIAQAIRRDRLAARKRNVT